MTRRRRKRSRSRSSSRPRSRSPSRQKGRWSATTEAQRVAHVVLFQEKNVVLNLSSPPPLSSCTISLRVYGARARPFEAHDCQHMYDGNLSKHARSDETRRNFSHHAAMQPRKIFVMADTQAIFMVLFIMQIRIFGKR